MIKKLLEFYKSPLLLSLALSVVLITARLESKVPYIIFIFLGALLGTFLLEVDRLLTFLVFEPKSTLSLEFKSLIKERNFEGALTFFEKQKPVNGGKTLLKSAVFQVILAVLSLYICMTTINPFAPALTLSALSQSFYYQLRDYQEKSDISDWFLVLKERPTKNFYLGYFIVLGLVFVASLLSVV
ncbi:hypothetical protein COY33_02660 [candidate division WWE3 bacterium CG_4_10_14_0_2_um_filter_42_7]|uniref:Uncharacterized protein n=2 Tax=Katanobacteria TaxID=422282 RepID=A0A2H0XC89_UNCKA|nr:MAG: hypothetical protein COT51_01200 [candidate division WWE3 bacterium CG08_land_8_20_14_0_20_41_15]PIZ42761.1 MAG: hypothetical protein COY33_02660 [candidate division WWE3 bacterium CG_4_10_14_0_2_um_filter_42_7]